MGHSLSVVALLAIAAFVSGCGQSKLEFERARAINYGHFKDGALHTVTATNVDGETLITRSVHREGKDAEKNGPNPLSAETFEKLWKGPTEIADILEGKQTGEDKDVDNRNFHFVGVMNMVGGTEDGDTEAFAVPAGKESDEFKAWLKLLLEGK